jgi:hypothetical protein
MKLGVHGLLPSFSAIISFIAFPPVFVFVFGIMQQTELCLSPLLDRLKLRNNTLVLCILSHHLSKNPNMNIDPTELASVYHADL